MDAGQCRGRNHVAHDFHRIMLNNTQIAYLRGFDATQQRPYPSIKNFNAEKVFMRTGQGNFCGGFPHAKTYFQDGRRLPPKSDCHIEGMRGVRNRPVAYQFLQRIALILRDMTSPVYETAYMRGEGWRGDA
jgi:hypothetical protein